MPTMTKKHRIRLVDPQGGRSPTAGSTSRRDKGRWSSRRKTEVVLRILCGETLDALSRELSVSPHRLAGWRDEAVAAMQAGLQSRELDHRDGFISRPQGQGRRPGYADRAP
jgi:transposase